jgi:hypothetical protein
MREEEKGNETELYQRIIFSPVSAHRACALHVQQSAEGDSTSSLRYARLL